MPTTVDRIFNFSAGPSVLPLPVLERIQQEMVVLPGVGMSVLEISHRSKAFTEIIAQAEAVLRALAGVPDTHAVLFLQGGASLQFSMVPMNLLGPGATADYVVTGSWSKKAVTEARRVGTVNVAATGEEGRFTRIPDASTFALTPDAAYVHVTSNNTIVGTQWQPEREPRLRAGSPPLVCDASSDILSRPLEVSRYGLLYAGAQKNLGPAGMTLVIVRRDLLERSADHLPSMLNFQVLASNRSLYNTPPVFAIYCVGLVMEWLTAEGGLDSLDERNRRKAGRLYGEIDRTGFYRGTADAGSRSLMNVTFRLREEALESRFVAEATAAGLDGLAGHRSVGGMRASIYNAFPEAGVEALVQFMAEFERRNG